MQPTHLGNFYIKNAGPNKIALIDRDQAITYGELDEKINRFASYFLSIGVKPGDRVALSCYNSPLFIYSYFAVTKIGAVIVPLNLMLTPDEAQYILTNSGAKILLAHEKIAQKLSIDAEQWKAKLNLEDIVIFNDKTVQTIDTYPIGALPEVDPNSICALLYTSGTMGKPKGVMLSHNNLLANAHSCNVSLEGTGDDVFLCMLPMFHSFGFTVCVLLPLFSGSSIVIHDTFNPKEALRSINEQGITVLPAVPAMYVILSQALKKRPLSLSTVRIMVSGGAPLPREILNLFLDQFEIPLLEGYGLTEASPVVSFNPLSGVKKLGSVGLPLQDIEVSIVDDSRTKLPSNEVGEIVVKGPNIMIGYYENPEETADTLRDGWLYTGDIGYVDEDGYLFIVDRKKDLIITRGLNVYPREVEEVIYSHPKVLEVAVIGSADRTRGEIVKAVIVLKEDQQLEKEELIDFLYDKLANYKLPRIVEFTDSLPKNAGGKIMKRLLT
ncbi:hypothetical protein BEP19_06425 [Ammoniphilus oxalaticus]|uniref:Long-chain fatty acid--CoA ligase n=1 Tax=Ammoniphilus oxalaticus TaxID=66863 RepID=A0A419SJB1_9BACL|nr:long-chain fatty acid--CoA ligase [Ammoniphilus oxalaticus]RKD24040.1 hypothetical protein BEP19_06425 [Ammoniphilus oxalaticus]